MKNINKTFVAGAVTGVLAAVAGAGAIAHANSVPAAQPAPHFYRVNKSCDYPEMQRALKALTNAQDALSDAHHDFHGHRAKALELTNRAIAEVQAGIASG